MIGAGPTSHDGLVAGARRYAALSAQFDPVAAFPAGKDADPDALVEAASVLAAACDVHAGAADRVWLMRVAERRYELRRLEEEGGLEQAVAARRAGDTGPETDDLLAALTGAPPFSEAAVAARLENPDSRDEVERIILALDRAGQAAPAHHLLDVARTALFAWDRRERRAQILSAGFVGREAERGALADWIRRPSSASRVRALFVSGLPGIGKSWLLEEAVRHAHEEGIGPIVVRLDFDRAGLDVGDQVGLTMEVARQVGERLSEGGSALLASRLEAASIHPDLIDEYRSREKLPSDLAAKIGAAVQSEGRSVLFVLDTLEVLRARGGSHPTRLFEWLDELVRAGVAPMAVIAAGRGDALDSAADRIAERRDLEELESDSAEQLLARLGVPEPLVGKLAALAEGNPLALRLGAKIVAREGGAFLERKVRGRLSASYLYRFLLSRISDPVLKRLAHPGLVMRRISPQIIAEVLAPRLGLGRIDRGRAKDLFEALEREHWLVEADPVAPGFVRHRSDMRRALLPLLYRDSPRLCARIDEAAMRWFASRSEEWCQVEALYHRLQLVRTQALPPPIDPARAVQFDAEMLQELTPKARDLVLASRGERTLDLREGATGTDYDRGLAAELLAIVERSDWSEGQHLVEKAVESGLHPRRPPADAVRAFYWRSGRWAQARAWLRERDRLDPGDEDLRDLAPEVQVARMEMRAEFSFDRLDDLIGGRSDLAELAVEQSWRAAETRAFGGGLVAAVAQQLGEDIPWNNPAFGLFGAARDFWSLDLRLPDHASAVEAATARLSRRIETSPDRLLDAGPPGMARLLSVDACFEGFIQILDNTYRRGALAAAAAPVDQRLSAVGGLFPKSKEARPVSPLDQQPIGGLAAMGLLAEWIEAQAFLDRDADLRLLGRSASLWRRAMAGSWCFGRRSPPWPSRPLDLSIEDRVRMLDTAADPVGEARAQLDLWLGDADHGARNGRALQRRLAGAIRAAGRSLAPDASAAAVAAALLRRRVPAAFAPGLAILVHRGKI